MWLILGLGNPDQKYAETYHNAGFRVLDRIAAEKGTTITSRCGAALISEEIAIGPESAVLAEPQTYMNRSGEALHGLFDRFHPGIQGLIVIYDDLALPIGKIRLRQKGSAGGHNGIKSIISSLGSDEFLRVRVGIQPDRPVASIHDFVLSPVTDHDRAVLDKAEIMAAKAMESVITDGIEKAMSVYNGVDLREEKDS